MALPSLKDLKKLSKMVETQGVTKTQTYATNQNLLPTQIKQKPVNLPVVKKKSTLLNDIAKTYENLGSGIIKTGIGIGNYLTNAVKNNVNKTSQLYNVPMGYKDSKGNKVIAPPSKSETKDLVLKGLNTMDKTTSNAMLKKDEQTVKATESVQNPFLKKVSQLTPTIGGMIPTIGASLVNPALALGVATTSAGGQYIQDAKNKGATDEKAFNYGSALGVAEGLTELLQLNTLTKGVKTIAKSGIKAGAKSLAISAAENAVQESIMEPIQETASQTILGKSNWKDMPKRMLQSGIDGATVSILMGGLGAGLGKSVNVANKVASGQKVAPIEVQQALQETKQSNIPTVTSPQVNTDTLTNQVTSNIPTNNNVVKPNVDTTNKANNIPIKQELTNPLYTDTKLSTLKLPNGEIVGKDSNVISNENSLDSTIPMQNVNKQVNVNMNVNNVPTSNDMASLDSTIPLKETKNVKPVKEEITIDELTNISSIQDKANYNKDLARNLDDMAGGNKQTRDYLYEKIEKPLNEAKKSYSKNVVNQLNTYKKAMDKLGIKSGGKESSATQWIGEKQRQGKDGELTEYTLDMLKKDFPTKWENIVEADKINRKMYDDYILAVNTALEQIYPNLKDGGESSSYIKERLVPRKDYYRHFTEMEQGFKGLANIISTPSDVASSLAGISEFTKPKSKFAGFMQHRGLGTYVEDAVKGMTKYIPVAEYKVNVEPIIAKQRDFIKVLENATEVTKSANRPIKYLTNYTNDLLGKTNPADRWLQDNVGRKTMATLDWVNSRVKANAILGNINSAFSQILNLPNATAYIKNPASWVKGSANWISDKMSGGKLIEKSTFMSERYMDNAFEQFNEGIGKTPEKFAKWLLTVGDKRSSELIWYSAYNNFVPSKRNGKRTYENAIDYADDITKKSVGGRGIGEIPLNQKAKVTQLLAPFQVEVNNSWQLMKEKLGDKDLLGIGNIVLTTFLLNGALEAITGNRPGGFDFIDAFQEAMKTIDDEEEKRKKSKENPMSLPSKIGTVAGRFIGETVSSMPFGNQFASLALSGNDTNAKKIFGNSDPTRFGTGNIGLNAIAAPAVQLLSGQNVDLISPVTSILPKFGGKQINKAIKGGQNLGILPRVDLNIQDGLQVKAPMQGSVSNSGGFRFPTNTDAVNTTKLLTLGEFSTDNGKEYLKSGKMPYGDAQTKLIETLNSTGLNSKETVTFIEKIKSIDNDESLKDILGAKTKAKNEYIKNSDYSDTIKSIMFTDILSKEQNIKIDEIVANTKLSKYEAQKIYTTSNDFKSDKDEFGQVIDGTLKNKVRDYVLSTNISNENKQYMYDKLGYQGNIVEYAKAKTKLASDKQFTSLDTKSQDEVLETVSNYYDKKNPEEQLKSLQADWQKDAKGKGISFEDYKSYRSATNDVKSNGNTNVDVTVNWLQNNKTLTADQRQWIYAVDSKTRTNEDSKLKTAELSGVDVAKFVTYQKAISQISGKDGNGYNVTNQKTNAVINYVQSLPLSLENKLVILYSNTTSSKLDGYRQGFAQYVDKLNIDVNSKRYILENLGYKIVNNQIKW